MPTIHDLKSDANEELAEWFEDNPDATEDEWQAMRSAIASDNVPAMATTLFQLVVVDNYLAYVDADSCGLTEPFGVLAMAVEQEILESLPTFEQRHEEHDDDD